MATNIVLRAGAGRALSRLLRVVIRRIARLWQRGPSAASKAASLAKVYEILGRRYDTGEHDLAARHNELEP